MMKPSAMRYLAIGLLVFAACDDSKSPEPGPGESAPVTPEKQTPPGAAPKEAKPQPLRVNTGKVCQSASDCESDLCIKLATESVCADPCATTGTSCSAGFECHAVKGAINPGDERQDAKDAPTEARPQVLSDIAQGARHAAACTHERARDTS